MRILVVLAAALLAILPRTASGEFVVKYFIDGHVVAPTGPTFGNAAWCADMNGDSSFEMLACKPYQVSGTPLWQVIGIAHISSGETEWIDFSTTGIQPLVGYHEVNGVSFPRPLSPFFWDADSDGLLDVFVPIITLEQEMKTAVIGWSGAAAAESSPQASTARLSLANPNPSSSAVSFDYFIPERAFVEFLVLDVTGRLVRKVIESEQDAGPHAVTWDGYTDSGRQAEVGTYFYSLKVDGVAVGERSSLLVR